MTLNCNTLQHRFIRSRAWRHFVREYCRANGIAGHDAVIAGVMAEMIEACSDNQIRDICALFLQEVELTPAEYLGLLRLLCKT